MFYGSRLVRSSTGFQSGKSYNYKTKTSTQVQSGSKSSLSGSFLLASAFGAVALGTTYLLSDDSKKRNDLLLEKVSHHMKQSTKWLDKVTEMDTVYAAEKVPVYGVPGTKKERSFIAIKPDGVNRLLVGEVISRFEKKGYKLVGIKILTPTKQFAEKHYEDLATKPFFPSLVQYFSSGPVVAMVWEGKDVISGGRKLIGATNPSGAECGSIRGDLCIQIGRNIIHGSDGVDSANHEISLWFSENEISDWDSALDKWVHEK